MLSKKKPVQVFVSYARRDKKYLDRLRANLAGLELEGRIVCWWDGVLETGQPWEPQIETALRAADVVILLLTANFMASQACMDELRKAMQREERGEKIDVIPLLVESYDLGSHWLGRMQMITIDGKAITESRQGSRAWAKVAEQIRLKIECLDGGRAVLQAINEWEETVHSGTLPLPEMDVASSEIQFPTVSGFWRADPALLKKAGIIRVQGTLSKYSPFLMGRPQAKRGLHLAFRRAIETHRRFGERKRVTINACLSLSAGQMVQIAVQTAKPKLIVGLYESIVRNSIPIFVLPEYYENELAPMLGQTEGSECFEAVVTGRPYLLNNNYIRRYLASQGMDQIIDRSFIDHVCTDAYALEVGGPGTGVHRLTDQVTRYLDGDVWLALQSPDGSERFSTGFTDISNFSERQAEMQRLRHESDGSRILAACDELQSLASLIE